MKGFKMIGIAVAAFALGSFLMLAGAVLAERGVAHAQTRPAPAAPAEQASPASPADAQQSNLVKAAVASAQEATSLPQ